MKISEQTGRMRLKWIPSRELCQNFNFCIHWVDDPRNSSLPKYKRYVRLLEEITKENMVMVNLRTNILSAGFLLCWPKFLIITNTSIIHVFPNCHRVLMSPKTYHTTPVFPNNNQYNTLHDAGKIHGVRVREEVWRDQQEAWGCPGGDEPWTEDYEADDDVRADNVCISKILHNYSLKELKKAEERADSNQKKVDCIDEELKVSMMMMIMMVNDVGDGLWWCWWWWFVMRF